MTRMGILKVAVVLLPMLAVGCGGEGDMTTGPSGMSGTGTMLLSVTPTGGAVGVTTNSAMVLRFSGPMASGMEPFVDLHQGGLDGPVVATRCDFSADRTTLRCTPSAPFSPGTTYTLHVGGGMRDSAGRSIDMGQYGGAMGGQWIMGLYRASFDTGNARFSGPAPSGEMGTGRYRHVMEGGPPGWDLGELPPFYGDRVELLIARELPVAGVGHRITLARHLRGITRRAGALPAAHLAPC